MVPAARLWILSKLVPMWRRTTYIDAQFLYHDDIRRAPNYGAGNHYVSRNKRGRAGRERILMMIGGETRSAAPDPIFAALANGIRAAPRTRRKEGQPADKVPSLGPRRCPFRQTVPRMEMS